MQKIDVGLSVRGRESYESHAVSVLEWGRELTIPYMRKAISDLPDSMRLVAGYHFGWWDENGAPTTGTNPGKLIRPALSLLSALAVGGVVADAVPAAAAVEFVHNFSLLHDDVMDRDAFRRHRPTAWKVFGEANAVLAGDVLLSLALCCVSAQGAGAVRVLNQSVVDLCVGQAADLKFENCDVIGIDDCWAMANGKTAALLGAACELGALAGGADRQRVALLGDFGRHLGLAFQLIDDLLGIWGDPEVTGKPVHADLANRKKSLPVVAALSQGLAPSQQLAELYQRESLDEEQLAHAATLVERAGGRAWAQRRAEEQVEAAMQCLAAADCESEAASHLRWVARLITNRDH